MTQNFRRWARQRVTATCVAVLAAALLLVGTLTPGLSPPASAANLATFNPGNIVSDAIFFNGTDMSAGEIQVFLNTKGSKCKPSAGGIPCLKDFSQTTETRAADARCTGRYDGATAESAATIVAKVAQACGISARALLVMLQKEQGLVLATGESLTARRYQIAMGFGCPDTAACDSQYYGFFNQVYRAASQFKNYAQNPTRFNHKAGAWNNVRFSPNAACGSSAVFVANQATAGLYNYTPYQPNAAALAAGYGTGDACSAYGNRNFYSYFQDWFASPSFDTSGAIDTWYRNGGAAIVGPPVNSAVTVGGGTQQSFARGTVSSSSAGTFATVGSINGGYVASNAAWGPLGLATGSERWDPAGGWIQEFQHASVYYGAATGFSYVYGAVRDTYRATGGPASSVGWPVSNEVCAAGSCYQDFLRPTGGLATITWSAATGAHLILNAIRDSWWDRGGIDSVGTAKTSEVATADGRGSQARFLRGTRESIVLWSAQTDAHAFGGSFLTSWDQTGGVTGLGYPTTDETATVDGLGSSAEFRNGTRPGILLWSPATGTHAMGGSFLNAWTASGGVRGLGYPTIDESAVPGTSGTYVELLNNGRRSNLMWSATSGVHAFGGSVRDTWLRTGGAKGLGFPTTDETAAADGLGAVTEFRNGSRVGIVLWSPATGAHSIGGDVRDAWQRSGGVRGLGYPTMDESTLAGTAGSYATFQNGSLRGIVLWSAGTGARFLSGPAYATWQAKGQAAGLGFPTADEAYLGLGTSTYVPFTRGSWVVTGPPGAFVVPPVVRDGWLLNGGATGYFGLPTAEAVTSGNKVTQQFQKGLVTVFQ